MTEISKAEIADLNDLVLMGRAFFYEAKWDYIFEWKDDSAASALTDLINDDNSLVFIAKEDGVAIGMASAVLYPVWYNTDILTAQEFFLYVTPEKRRGVGHKLKTKLEEGARSKGARAMAMGSVDSMPSLEAYYARGGYEPSERTFIKRL